VGLLEMFLSALGIDRPVPFRVWDNGRVRKRIWKAVAATWGIYRHGAALKGLLESLGLWKYVAFGIAAIMSGAYAFFSGLPVPLQVVAGLLGFAGILFVVGFGIVLVRVLKLEPSPDTSMAGASIAGFHGKLETKFIPGKEASDSIPPSALSGVADSLSNQFLQTTENEIPVQMRAYRDGIIIAAKQMQDTEKALPARIVVSDIREKLQDGKLVTTRLLHSRSGRFNYDAIQLQRVGGEGDLYYRDDGLWWMVTPKGHLQMFWPGRPDRPTIQLPPGEYVADLRIWVGNRNIPFQATWSIDAERRATCAKTDDASSCADFK
jgi:hypothetical protein